MLKKLSQGGFAKYLKIHPAIPCSFICTSTSAETTPKEICGIPIDNLLTSKFFVVLNISH